MSPGYHFFASTWYLLVHIDAVVSCITWWNLRQFNIIQLFSHKLD